MRILAIVLVLTVAACAKQPDQISAVDIGPNPYLRHSCKNLAQEKLALEQNLANLSAAQKNAASGDTMGVILLGLPLSSMSGNDKETAIAVTKGKLQAVETARASRNC